MVESVVSLLVVAVMSVAALRTVGASAKLRIQQQDRTRGLALAASLLTEIMQTHYADPNVTPVFGPETGETSRAMFNDVDDYNGWTESPPAGFDGTPLPGFTGWTRTVTVAWADPTNPQNTSGSESGLKRIVVTVTSPNLRVTKLVGLRSASSQYEDMPTGTTSYTSWVGLSLQIGADPTSKCVGGAHTLNQVP